MQGPNITGPIYVRLALRACLVVTSLGADVSLGYIEIYKKLIMYSNMPQCRVYGCRMIPIGRFNEKRVGC